MVMESAFFSGYLACRSLIENAAAVLQATITILAHCAKSRSNA
jgi:hypothetical protein